ncbi:MAG: putative quinol monooxygenase [Microbacteriaceae bacterium]
MDIAIGVIVSVRVRAGLAHEQVALFERIAPLVRAEVGCLSYELHSVVGDENGFVILEWWASQAALSAHEVAAHMVQADAASSAFRDGPAEVTVIER